MDPHLTIRKAETCGIIAMVTAAMCAGFTDIAVLVTKLSATKTRTGAAAATNIMRMLAPMRAGAGMPGLPGMPGGHPRGMPLHNRGGPGDWQQRGWPPGTHAALGTHHSS